MDRNKYVVQCRKVLGVSLSARRAWIEIIDDLEPSTTRRVALRKESVDRNTTTITTYIVSKVALRKESVDRNPVSGCKLTACLMSLSARRAWIEIKLNIRQIQKIEKSLSARRAWIEIR